MFLSSRPKLNIDKSECILLGPLKNACKSIENIKVTNAAVKTLGIYIGHDKYKCLEKKWQDKFDKISKILGSWEKRKLTLFGKKEIINTLIISKLQNNATILTSPPLKIIQQINKLILLFYRGIRIVLKEKILFERNIKEELT